MIFGDISVKDLKAIVHACKAKNPPKESTIAFHKEMFMVPIELTHSAAERSFMGRNCPIEPICIRKGGSHDTRPKAEEQLEDHILRTTYNWLNWHRKIDQPSLYVDTDLIDNGGTPKEMMRYRNPWADFIIKNELARYFYSTTQIRDDRQALLRFFAFRTTTYQAIKAVSPVKGKPYQLVEAPKQGLMYLVYAKSVPDPKLRLKYLKEAAQDTNRAEK